MKVAVPTFGDRVSPRFDCAASFLVLTVEQGVIVQREEVSATSWTLHERIHAVVRLGVRVVICGGIDRWSAATLRSAGITLYGWVAGSIEESLDSLRRGELQAWVTPDEVVGDEGAGVGQDVVASPEGAGQTGLLRRLRPRRRHGNQDLPGD